MLERLNRYHPKLWFGAAIVAVIAWAIWSQHSDRPRTQNPDVDQARKLLRLDGDLYALEKRLRLARTASAPEDVKEKAPLPVLRVADITRAHELLQRAVEADPDNDRAHFNLGIAYLFRAQAGSHLPDPESRMRRRVQDMQQGKACLDAAIKINPNNLDAYRGQLLYFNRLTALAQHAPPYSAAEVIAACRRVLQHAPSDMLAQAILAKHLFLDSKLEEMERVILAMLKRKDISTSDYLIKENLMRLSRYYTQQGKFKEAEALLLKSVEKWEHPKRSARGYYTGCPYQALGELYASMGKYDKANSSFLKAADFKGGGPVDLFLFAMEMFNKGSYDITLKSVADIERYCKKNDQPKNAELLSQALVLKGYIQIFKKDYGGSSQTFDAALALHKGNLGAVVGKGHLKIIARGFAEASRMLEPAVVKSQKSWQPHRNQGLQGVHFGWLTLKMAALGMGWVSANQNRHERAVGYYDKILAHEPNDMLAQVGKATSLIALHRLDESELLFNKVLEIDPKNQYALAELGIIEYNRRNYAKAEARFKESLKHATPGYTCPHEGLGLVYLSQNRIAEAKEYFKQAIKLNPKMEYKKFNGLAKIYIKEGKYAEARKLLKRSTENFPYNDEAKNLLKKIRGR